MDTQSFVRHFGQLYRELYQRAVRRIDDPRDAPSAETTALLLHLAQAGPMTLSELSRHFDRALSTLSAKVSALETQGLLARQRDDTDARRALIWLSPAGREHLLQALEVLDHVLLATAAQALSPEQRSTLLTGLQSLIAALPHHHATLTKELRDDPPV
jgi:DNA-binding MarR family transcriptional regulator